MAAGERSISDVLQDIVRNVQDIIRSEVRLARSEVVQELSKLKEAAPLIAVGAAASLLAGLFLVWTAVYALALVVPMWAAALIVAAILGAAGAFGLAAGVARLRRVDPKPEKTIASVKENVQWARQQLR